VSAGGTQRDSYRLLIALGAAAFVAMLLVRFPLRWATAVLPQSVSCEDPRGTAWSGSCGQLFAAGASLGATRWRLQPLWLLAGRLQARVISYPPRAQLDGLLSASVFGRVGARNLVVEIELGPGGLAQLPANLRGRARAQLDELQWRDGRLAALRGRVTARDLVQDGNPPLPLGDYDVVFEQAPEPNGDIVGRLKDAGGPLEVTGTLRLTSPPGYLLDGTVAPRADAAPVLVRQLAFLGTPDAAGRRPFSVEATF
jgi:hypothetical protein